MVLRKGDIVFDVKDEQQIKAFLANGWTEEAQGYAKMKPEQPKKNDH